MADDIKGKYGLIIRKDTSSSRTRKLKVASAFDDDSSDDDTLAKAKLSVNQTILQENAKKKVSKQTQIEIEKAISEDPTVYEYDAVYDSMESKKNDIFVKKKEDSRKPKYINNLLKSAENRKQEQERRVERKIQKEREAEGDEFADKEAFVTDAYRKKMLEREAEEEKLKEKERLEALNEVTKQNDLGHFYRNLMTHNVAMGGRDDTSKQEKSSKVEEKTEHKESANTANTHVRQDSYEETDPRHSASESNRDDNARKSNIERPSKEKESKKRSHRHRRSSSIDEERDRNVRNHKEKYEDTRRHSHKDDRKEHRRRRSPSHSSPSDVEDQRNNRNRKSRRRPLSDEAERHHKRHTSAKRESSKGDQVQMSVESSYKRRRDDDHGRKGEKSKETRQRTTLPIAKDDGTDNIPAHGNDLSDSNEDEVQYSNVNSKIKKDDKKTIKSNGDTATDFYSMRTDSNSIASARERYLMRKGGRGNVAASSDSED